MKTMLKRVWQAIPSGIVCLCVIFALFGYIGSIMGVPNMLNTIMKTAHDLLLNTVFYLMGICVITGAIGRLFVEFGVVSLLEKLLRPLMRPLFNLPGVASLGAVMTFLSDNPAIISLSQDKRFSSYFKKYQFISLTNFGTAFGMGLLVMVFMVGQGFYIEPIVGLFGAFVGCIVSTRLMQRKILKAYPQYADEQVCDRHEAEEEEREEEQKSVFLRTLNSLLDGGRTGVDIGIAIIPGVLIISTLVMMLTFGAGANGYDGSPYQGVELLPWLANKIDFLFAWLFGFNDPHQVAFPITALGAVGRVARPDTRIYERRMDRRQRHCRVHSHRNVLERIPQHPYSHARFSRLSRTYFKGNRIAYHWRNSCRHGCSLDLCAGNAHIKKFLF